ncbi:MAG TPA: GNAT family N-acetyltransferase [Ktedonobacteraceae bacterium]|nr:GNAT family N-acetyltransferase [Ktedonobacteraceae bacterium]
MSKTAPPPGYVTATEAKHILGDQGNMLQRYIKAGHIKRYTPPFRKQGYYKRDEIEAFKTSIDAFYHPSMTELATFQRAHESDMKDIGTIDLATFGGTLREKIYRKWAKANKETFYALRTPAGKVIGYACILPLDKAVMDQYIKGEVALEEIPIEAIKRFEPGESLHLYVVAMAVDPSYKRSLKEGYGARLLYGILDVLMGMARRGVEIETITARSFKTDGIRLLRRMGIPQLRSPVPSMQLFSLKVAESGYPLIMRYCSLLEQWKREHQS